MKIIRGNYSYRNNTIDGSIEVENTKTGEINYIYSEDPENDMKLIQQGSDPIKDSWEDGNGNILYSLFEEK